MYKTIGPYSDRCRSVVPIPQLWAYASCVRHQAHLIYRYRSTSSAATARLSHQLGCHCAVQGHQLGCHCAAQSPAELPRYHQQSSGRHQSQLRTLTITSHSHNHLRDGTHKTRTPIKLPAFPHIHPHHRWAQR